MGERVDACERVCMRVRVHAKEKSIGVREIDEYAGIHTHSHTHHTYTLSLKSIGDHLDVGTDPLLRKRLGHVFLNKRPHLLCQCLTARLIRLAA